MGEPSFYRCSAPRCAVARDAVRSDPWRKRMTKLAETLRRLDEGRFRQQIARIEESLRVDAAWNLEAALASSHRAHGSSLLDF